MEFEEIKKYLILAMAIGSLIFAIIAINLTSDLSAHMNSIYTWSLIIITILIATNFYD